MKRRCQFKAIAFLLALVMLFGMMPVTALETETTTSETSIPEAETAVPSVGKVPNPDYTEESQTCEVIERREANVKHFRLEDGSYEAVAYGYPVHRKDADGEWQDIDNRLFSKVVGGKAVHATADSRVTFANQAGSGALMTLSENGYTIRMGYLPPSNTVITASQPAVIANHASREAQLQAISPELSEAEKLEQLHVVNNTTSVVYESVQQGIDLKYVLQANDIKEYIVVEAPQSAYVYQFGLLLEGLEAELTEQGDIILRDSETDEEPYTIPAPFMVDANGVVSTDVCYELEQIGDGAYILKVEADAAWFGQAERAYPVMIDPTINPTDTIQDTFVNAGDPNGIYKDWAVWVGASYIGLFKATMPALPSGATLMGGTLSVAYYYQNGFSGSRTIGAYQMTRHWAKSSVTYNSLYNQYGSSLGISSTLLDATAAPASIWITSSIPRWISFDIDEAVESWYNGTTNNGIALKHMSGTPTNIHGETIGTVIVDSEANTPYTAFFTVKYLMGPLAEGVYRLKSAYNGLYADIYEGYPDAGTQVIQWTSNSGDGQLNQMFKFTYLGIHGDYHYYSIRPMINSGLLLETPLSGSNRNATIEEYSTNDSWSNLLYNHLWAVDQMGSYYTLKNGNTTEASYLQTPSNSNTGAALFTSSSKGSTANWILEPYTGGRLESLIYTSQTGELFVGENFTFSAYMYDSEIGKNGPVTFGVANTDWTATDKATMTSYGKLTALKPGVVRVYATYEGALWRWYIDVTIHDSLEKTFYLKNQEDHTYLQIEEDDAPNYNSDQATIEAREFTSGEYQKWNVVHVSDRYYKIVSVKSGKVIAVQSGKENTGDELLVQESYTGSSRQLWKFEKLSSGAYLIRPKSGEAYATDWCMANGDFSENKQVQQRECKTDNRSYKEEWILLDAETYAHVTLPLMVYYDSLTLDVQSIKTYGGLEYVFEDVVNMFQSKFNIKFDIQGIALSSQLEWDKDHCSATTPDDICSSQCGSLASCNTTHHKSGERLLSLLQDDNMYVCRVVGYELCKWENNAHTQESAGIAYVGGKDSIIMVYDQRLEEIQVTILHELSHNLGLEHCTSNCIMNGVLGDNYSWCPYHIAQIQEYLKEQ